MTNDGMTNQIRNPKSEDFRIDTSFALGFDWSFIIRPRFYARIIDYNSPIFRLNISCKNLTILRNSARRSVKNDILLLCLLWVQIQGL